MRNLVLKLVQVTKSEIVAMVPELPMRTLVLELVNVTCLEQLLWHVYT